MTQDYRIERDSMGEMRVPSHYLYGASTARAVENFSISGLRMSRTFIRMLALIKKACAKANEQLGHLKPEIANAIVHACDRIAEGTYDDHFVVDVFQTGSGTSTNMNFNEVAANIANLSVSSAVGSKSPVHPNDHVNLGQSSNDVIPTAIHVASAYGIQERLIPALEALEGTLVKKQKEFSSIIKIGRTHLQDATPMTLGQEFSGYEAQVSNGISRLKRALPSLYELAIGGTAVGTGINTDEKFSRTVSHYLSKMLGIEFRETSNHFEAQATKDACVEVSGALKSVAVSLTKIAHDIRCLGSGPRCGLGELILPAVQPGSSIMPGKVNPVIAEALIQVCAEVIGNDVTITLGGLGSYFELNVMMPLIAYKLGCSIDYLSNAVSAFDSKCVQGILANRAHIDQSVEKSLMLATALTPQIGYDKAAEISKKAYVEQKTIREVCLEKIQRGELPLSESQLSESLDLSHMVSPGLKGGGGE